MDGISGASAVIALGGFVATNIQQLNKLIKDVAKAPEELLALVRYLEDFKDSLNGTAEFIQHFHSASDQKNFLNGINNAVEYCADTIKSIEVLINKAKGSRSPQNQLQKKLSSLKYVLKKDEIDEMQTRLDRAVTRLNFAISVNSLHQNKMTQDLFTNLTQCLVTERRLLLLTDTSEPNLGPVAEKELSLIFDSSQPAIIQRPISSANSSSLLKPSSSTSHNRGSRLLSLDAGEPLRTVSKTNVMTWYNGILGNVTIQKWSKSVSNALNAHIANARSTSEEMVIVLRPSFLRNHFELHFVESFGHIPRTLNVDRVVDYRDPVFDMCRSGDIIGLHSAFCEGRASLYTVDSWGTSLLHCAAANHQLEICKWLLSNGANADKVDIKGSKALCCTGTTSSRYRERDTTRNILDIVRLLVHKQEDLSAFDVSHYFQQYYGPPEGAELVLSEYPVQYDRRSLDDYYAEGYPPLAAILRAYAEEPSAWESVLRTMIRRGADLHARVRRHRRYMNTVGYPCHMADYGTPLDELFSRNKDPFAAKIAADGWLRVLASEGHDPSNYLMGEFILRTEEMHFTHPSIRSADHRSPRKLFFEFGDRPSVFWDWWIDPKSSISLLREEFRCLTQVSLYWFGLSSREESWPYTLPLWSLLHQEYGHGAWPSECEASCKLADDRAIARTKAKAAKLLRAQRGKRPRRVPGAWPM